jgi:hypothetical protein
MSLNKTAYLITIGEPDIDGIMADGIMADEFEEAIRMAQSEALASFGDDADSKD